MTYATTTNIPDTAVRAALAVVSTQPGNPRLPGLIDALIAAGGTVTLDTGQTVWCACIFADDPATPAVELCVVAAEFVAGALRTKPNGQPVACVSWPSMTVNHLTDWTAGVVRKAALMIALGEPQPQVPIDNPDEGGATEQDVFVLSDSAALNMSIRTWIAAADATTAPLTDVL